MLRHKKTFIFFGLIGYMLMDCSALFAQDSVKKQTPVWDMQNIMSQLQAFITSYGLKIIGAILILIAGRIVAGIARKLIVKLLTKARVDETITSFVSPLIFFLILTFTVIAALSKFGVETTSFVAIIGAATFAVGLALQGSLSNFAAGVMILLFRPYKVGNAIESAGVAGTVKEVHIFSTTISTLDNIKVIIPNSKIYGDVIKNMTGYDTRRVVLEVGISYGSPIEKAIEIAMNILKAEPLVLNEPEPMVAVFDLADSSVNLTVRFWVETPNYWDVRFAMLRKIKEAYDDNDIEIPFPQRVVHMTNR